MNIKDRYSFGVTFHEASKTDQMKNATAVNFRTGRSRAPSKAPKSYLGKSITNLYDPVLICWTGSHQWHENCGSLWYSPQTMRLKTVHMSKPLDGLEYVAIEDVMVREILREREKETNIEQQIYTYAPTYLYPFLPFLLPLFLYVRV
jgi:hypothetical protein